MDHRLAGASVIIDDTEAHVSSIDAFCNNVVDPLSNTSSCFSNSCTHNHMCATSMYSLWHYRLGHVPFVKLKQIPQIFIDIRKSCTDSEICLTCPMDKMVKLPFSSSSSESNGLFDMIHIDI